MAKQFTLGKKERLKSRKAIEQLFKEGKRFSVAPFRIFFLVKKESEGHPLQFGAGVSTKNFKKAVDRNRIKRLTREAWRLQKMELEQHVITSNVALNIFFIYTEKEIPDYTTVSEKVHLILNKMIRLFHENNTPHT